jgi:hypothetical protein
LYAFLFSPIRATFPVNLVLLDLIILIILGQVQFMKLLIMQFSVSSYHFIPLRSRYSPQHPLLKYPQSMCFSYVLNPYKTTGYIIVLYTLSFMFLDSRRGDRRF